MNLKKLTLAILPILFNVSFVEAQEGPEVLYPKMESLYKQGKFQEALPIARELLEMSKKENGPESTETISMMRYVAQMDTTLGNVDEAEKYLLQAETTLSKSPTPTQQYARTLGDLSRLYYDQKLDFAKTEIYLKRSIAILEKVAPADAGDLGTALNNLATLYEREGRQQEALSIDKRIVELREKALPAVDANLAHSLLARGHVYSDLHEYHNAESDLKRALSILQTIEGSDHRDVAQVYAVLAEAELGMGRLDESSLHWQQALEISKATDGPTSLHVAYALAGLAAIDAKRKEFDKAQAGYLQVIAMVKESWGAQDPRIAWQLRSIGDLYLEQGKLDDAESNLMQAALILQKRYGADTPFLTLVLLDLAVVERKKQGYAAALGYASQALSIDEQLPEPPNGLLSRELVEIALSQLGSGNCAEANASSTRAVEIEMGHELDDPKGYRGALLARSKVLECLGKTEEAAQFLERANSIKSE
jgi:tetratricopeptide (TPR) repeat protein